MLALPERTLVDEAGGFLLLLDGRLGDLRELGEAEQNDESESEASNTEVDVSARQVERQQGREGAREGGAMGEKGVRRGPERGLLNSAERVLVL